MVDHRLQLSGFATLRDEDRDIALSGHAEVTVDRFSKVQEYRGGSGRGESRCDLARHMARFAQAADDQLAPAATDQVDRLLERRAKLVGKRVERACFVVKDCPPEREDTDRRIAVCCHGRTPRHALSACEA